MLFLPGSIRTHGSVVLFAVLVAPRRHVLFVTRLALAAQAVSGVRIFVKIRHAFFALAFTTGFCAHSCPFHLFLIVYYDSGAYYIKIS